MDSFVREIENTRVHFILLQMKDSPIKDGMAIDLTILPRRILYNVFNKLHTKMYLLCKIMVLKQDDLG